MSATRTQVYLTDQQRARIDEIVNAEHVTLAEVVRRALDQYLGDRVADSDQALASTFGVDPAVEVPGRDEWDRG